MVADVCCGFKKGRGMVVDVRWCFKKGSAVVLVSGKEWHGSFWDGLTRGIMLL